MLMYLKKWEQPISAILMDLVMSAFSADGPCRDLT